LQFLLETSREYLHGTHRRGEEQLLNRVRRIIGQAAAIDKALDQETADCSEMAREDETRKELR
jgi:hypothetical protein